MINTEEAYKALEACVGPENISREPAILDGYSWQPLANMDPNIWVNRPFAVALPATTEEVQAIIKTCNKHGLKFKAFSTGWGAWGAPGEENVVQIDLRRMNRIIEIDAKNMRAVVEPYVSGAQLQAEAWKVGLNTNIVGAGPNCSPLAAATSAWGLGHSGVYMSYSARNVLGMEWVTPEGEIVSIGSCGSGLDSFVGDGPGPSLRGIVRGSLGAFSALGVFTKCSLKLYNWPGPPEMKADGLVVNSSLKEIPDNLVAYSCYFPNAKKLADAVHLIGEAEIGYNLTRTSMAAGAVCLVPHLFDKIMETSSIKTILTKTLRYLVSIVLAGTSKGDLEYQEKALREIVLECGGFCQCQKDSPAMNELTLLSTVRATLPALVFRHGGCFHTAMARNDSIELQMNWTEKMAESKEQLIKEGKLLNDSADTAYFVTFENGTWAHAEQTYQYDPRDPKQMAYLEEIAVDLVIEACSMNMESYFVHEPLPRTFMSPLCGNPLEYQKAISKMMDPNQSADGKFYTREVPIDWNVISEDKKKILQDLQKRYTWTDDGPPER